LATKKEMARLPARARLDSNLPDALQGKEQPTATNCDTLETVTTYPVQTAPLAYLSEQAAENNLGVARRHNAERLQL
jgi:hypothetical protein